MLDNPILSAIGKCRVLLTSDINMDEIIDELVSEEIITDDEEEDIFNESNKKAQVRKFIGILKKKTDIKYGKFVEILKNLKNLKHIAIKLESEYNQIISAISDSSDSNQIRSKLKRYGIPDPPINLVHRNESVNTLRSELKKLGRNPGWILVHGQGGIGKSVLASVSLDDSEIVENIYNHNIIWLVIGKLKETDTLAFLENVLTRLNPDATLTKNSIQTHNAIKRHINENGGTLIILDDVWDETVIRDMDFGAPVMVTSRQTNILDGITKSNQIYKMHVKEGFSLDESKALFGQANDDQRSAELEKTIEDYHKEFNGLPLAMSLISADVKTHMKLEPSGRTLNKISGVIKISIDALDEDLKQKYESLVIFRFDTLISCETLSLYWNLDEDSVVDHMDELVDRSLCYKEFDSGLSAYRYGLHDDLVYFLNKNSLTKERIVQYHRKFLTNVKEKCDENWEKLNLRDTYIWSEMIYHHLQAEWNVQLLELYQDLRFLVVKMRLLSADSVIDDMKKFIGSTTVDSNQSILNEYRSFLLKNKFLLRSHLPHGPYIHSRRKSVPAIPKIHSITDSRARSRHGSGLVQKRPVSPSGWVNHASKSCDGIAASHEETTANKESDMLALIIQLGLCETHNSPVYRAAFQLAKQSRQFYWELCNSDIQSSKIVEWSTYLPGDSSIRLIQPQLKNERSLLVANAAGQFKSLDIEYGDVIESEWIGEDIKTQNDDGNPVIVVQLSADYILTAGPDTCIRVWHKDTANSSSAQPFKTLENVGQITCCAYNGKDLLYAGMQDGFINVFNCSSSSGDIDLSHSIVGSEDKSPITTLMLKGNFLLCAEGTRVKIYDDNDMEWTASKELNPLPTDVTFIKQEWLAYSYGSTIEMTSYDLESVKRTYSTPCPSSDYINAFCHSNCCLYMAAASTSANVVVWDFERATILFNFWEHSSPVTSVLFTPIIPSGKWSLATVKGISSSCGPTSYMVDNPLMSGCLISGSSNGTVLTFSLKEAKIDKNVLEEEDKGNESRTQLFRIRLRSKFEAWFGQNADDTMMVVGQTPKNKIVLVSKCYSQSNPSQEYYTKVVPKFCDIPEQDSMAVVYAINCPGTLVAVAFKSSVIQIFSLKWESLRLNGATCSHQFHFSADPTCLVFASLPQDVKVVIGADATGQLQVFSLSGNDKQPICSVSDAHNGRIQKCLYLTKTKEGSILTVGLTDGLVKLWRIDSSPEGFHLKFTKQINAHEQNIFDCDVDSSEKFLVTGSADKSAKVWDLISGQNRYNLSGKHLDCVRVCRFCPGRDDCVATGDDCGALRVWKLGISSNISEKYDVDFSRDSCPSDALKSVCSSYDHMSNTTAWITDLIWSEDGRTLITASDCLRSWRLEEDFSQVQRTLHLGKDKVDRVRGDIRQLVTVDQAGRLYILRQVGLPDSNTISANAAIMSLQEDQANRRMSMGDIHESQSTISPTSY